MKKINRLMTNICSDKLVETKEFYTTLFDFEINFDSDWYIQLVSGDQQMELGIISRTHELVPKDFQKPPQGFYLTFVVDSVDSIHEIASTSGFDIVQKPENTFYGQRRMLLKDPNGTLVDISSLIKD